MIPFFQIRPTHKTYSDYLVDWLGYKYEFEVTILPIGGKMSNGYGEGYKRFKDIVFTSLYNGLRILEPVQFEKYNTIGATWYNHPYFENNNE